MRPRTRNLLALFLLTCASAVTHGGQVQAHDSTTGLPQNSATALAVDRFGMLWAGTEDGLARFDGSRFVAFSDAVDKGQIAGNYVIALASDAEYVWIAAESGGLARFDVLHERFEVIDVRNPVVGGALNVWSLLPLADRLLVGTRDHGVFALDRTDPRRILAHWHPAGAAGRQLPKGGVRDLIHDVRRHGYWVAGESGLHFIDERNGQVQSDPLVGIDRSIKQADVSGIRIDAAGTIWLGLRGHGVMRRAPGAEAFNAPRWRDSTTATPDIVPLVNRLELLAAGNIVAGTDRGILVFDPICDCLHSPAVDNGDRAGFSNALVLSVLEADGLLWVGTWNRGLFRLDPGAPGFDLMTPVQLGGEQAPAQPRSLYVDARQQLWVGTFGGGAYSAPVAESGMQHWSWQPWRSTGESRDRQVWAFTETAAGDLFIGTDAGVTRLRADRRAQTYLDLDPGAMDTLRCMMTASDGFVLASAVGGVYRIDPETLAFKRYAGNDGLADTRAYALIEWPRGEIVIGTWSGLFRMPLKGGRIQPMPLHSDGTAMDSGLVWDLEADSDGSLWIGSSTGLLHVPVGGGNALRYTEHDGLPNRVVYAIEPATDGALWLSTNRGIARFDRTTRRAIAFDVRDGLQGDEFGFGMAAQDRNGQIYFAGLNGVSRFNPSAIHLDARPPHAAITQLFLRNRALAVGERAAGAVVLERSLQATTGIVLSHLDADIGFAYSAMSTEPLDRLKFQYRLSGYDGDWIDAGLRRYVGYTNLAPGDYAFNLRAADRFGRFGPVRALAIRITPPLWATWPFRVGAGLLVVAFVLLAMRWRFAALTRSQALLAAEVARQTERIRIQNEQLEAANAALFDRSIRDPLTDAFNRRHFMELAANAYRHCCERGQPFALVLIDVDHFKQVNDHHGHAAGDSVLRALVHLLQPLLAPAEALARFGGEEFLIMLPEHDGARAAQRAAAWRAQLHELRVPAGSALLKVTASFGVAHAGAQHQPPLESLLANADAALYRAKAAGRDRVALATP